MLLWPTTEIKCDDENWNERTRKKKKHLSYALRVCVFFPAPNHMWNSAIQNQCDVCSFVLLCKSPLSLATDSQIKERENITSLSVVLITGPRSLFSCRCSCCLIFNSTVIDYYLNWSSAGGSRIRNNSFSCSFVFRAQCWIAETPERQREWIESTVLNTSLLFEVRYRHPTIKWEEKINRNITTTKLILKIDQRNWC